jgi:hypothetical protein
MQHIISGVKALYPRLNATYRFDQEEYKSQKCSPDAEGAAYEMSFNLTGEQCKELNAICMQAYKNAAAMDANSKRKWPEQPLSLPYKRDDAKQGDWIGKAKLKGAYSGEVTNPPRQVDASRKKLPEGFELTSGSTVNIACTVVPYNTGTLNGVSLRLRAVQVLELAEKQEADDPFTEVSGGYSGGASPINGVEHDPFGLPPATPTASNDLEDDIPF